MNNRGETVEITKRAIKLLKNNCYKIDVHLMLNLYGSSPELDREMLNLILEEQELQVDQLKIYPCAIVPFTKIKELYDTGIYIPYEDKYLFELIKEFKIKIKEYIRINRIIRDISGHYIIAGYSQQFTNLRQILNEDMRINKWNCRCIRCREVKGNKINDKDVKLRVIKYLGSDADEYFISYETQRYLIGFLRLRLNTDYSSSLLSLINAGLIRELHIYSTLTDVGNTLKESMQHKGYGKRLIAIAEEIAKKQGFTKMAIIAGTGVRNYYRKLGYELDDTYMCKKLG
jgi:ELP3 family radical SAM enzyme/protein acetyltransferase